MLRAEWYVELRGWPARSLWSRPRTSYLEDAWVTREPEGGIVTSLEPWTAMNLPRVLPMRPIWRGFVINTIAYGLLAWAALFGRIEIHIRHPNPHTRDRLQLRGRDYDVCIQRLKSRN